jgi:hypothetical protein
VEISCTEIPVGGRQQFWQFGEDLAYFCILGILKKKTLRVYRFGALEEFFELFYGVADAGDGPGLSPLVESEGLEGGWLMPWPFEFSLDGQAVVGDGEVRFTGSLGGRAMYFEPEDGLSVFFHLFE